MNKKPYGFSIPSEDLAKKISDATIHLWACINIENGTYLGVFTDKEKREHIEKFEWATKSNFYWEKVEFTLNELVKQYKL